MAAASSVSFPSSRPWLSSLIPMWRELFVNRPLLPSTSLRQPRRRTGAINSLSAEEPGEPGRKSMGINISINKIRRFIQQLAGLYGRINIPPGVSKSKTTAAALLPGLFEERSGIEASLTISSVTEMVKTTFSAAPNGKEESAAEQNQQENTCPSSSNQYPLSADIP